MGLVRGRRKNRVNPLTEGITNRQKKHRVWGLLVIDRYYIVDLKNILKPRYIPKPLFSRKEARFVINSFLDGDHDRFTIESGKTIAIYKIRAYRYFLRKKITKALLNLKYDYPVHCITPQQKKDFRTISRRRMRRWLEKLELS